MSKHAEIIAKGLVFDNVIDDMMREINLFSENTQDIYYDYKYYKPCIMNCDELYRFLSLKFYTKESVMITYREFLSQADMGIYNFIDYCIVEFTRSFAMENISELERTLINKKLNQRLQKLNRSIQ